MERCNFIIFFWLTNKLPDGVICCLHIRCQTERTIYLFSLHVMLRRFPVLHFQYSLNSNPTIDTLPIETGTQHPLYCRATESINTISHAWKLHFPTKLVHWVNYDGSMFFCYALPSQINGFFIHLPTQAISNKQASVLEIFINWNIMIRIVGSMAAVRCVCVVCW